MQYATLSETILRARGLTKIYEESAGGRDLLGRLRQGATAITGRKSRPAIIDIDLDVRRGETVGILGLNGAGKTTLLSVLSGVLKATRGTVELDGSLVPLLGVGTSFTPELSGRENAELNLLMMGMSRRYVRQRLPLVEAFADIGHHFDAPLWTYSSGMVARVAFAAALQIDADILVVDETLSVGDASFREKCRRELDKIREGGRAFLLVSHAPPLVTRMCARAIVLDAGRKVFDGDPSAAVEAYQALIERNSKKAKTIRQIGGPSKIDRAAIADPRFRTESNDSGEVGIISTALHLEASVDTPWLFLNIRSTSGVVLAEMPWRELSPMDRSIGSGSTPIEIRFDQRLLRGSYVCTILVADRKVGSLRAIGDEVHDDIVARHIFRLDIQGSPPERMAGYLNLDMNITAISNG